MQKRSKKYQHGAAHLVLIAITVVLVGVVGYIGFRALAKNTSLGDALDNKVASITANKECMDEFDDKDICKFLSNWSGNQKYRLESTATSDGQTHTSTMKVNGDKSYFKIDGEYAMEVIFIGDTTYTKAGETWWKRTAEKVDSPDFAPSKEDLDFEEPTEEDKAISTKYVKVGKEACGEFNCFKYQVVHTDDSETTEFIWFDDKEYLIRKMLTESSDGYKSESTFDYEDTSVDVPSPVQELAPNQYIVPGQTEPQIMPDVPQTPTEAELEEMMQQYME